MNQNANTLYGILKRSFFIEWLFAFVLVLIARLPYLLSDHSFFDGDEAMIGIMAMDLLSLRELPIYFYGQQYGFSFFEVVSAAVFIPFFGNGLLSLKLGGILLFSLGISRILRLLRKRNLPVISFILLALTLALFPAWQVWATKLRGGYITAFVVLCFMAEHLFTSENWSRKQLIFIAISSVIIVLAQPFFLLVVLPQVVRKLFGSKILDVGIAGIIGLVVFAILRYPAHLNIQTFDPSAFGYFHWKHLNTFFIEGFWASATGFFTYSTIMDVPAAVKIGAMAFVLSVAILLAYLLFVGSKSDKITVLLMLLGMGISVIPVTFSLGGCRYLIPFQTGIFFLAVFIALRLEVAASWKKSLTLICAIGVLIPTTTGYDQLENHPLTKDRKDLSTLTEVTEELKKQNFKHGFVVDWQVAWQLNYLCYDEIDFRFINNIDRVQRMVHSANECYFEDDCALAVVGTYWRASTDTTDPNRVNERFYILNNPPDSVLTAIGFHLPNADLRHRYP